ncbi:MAG: type I-B CRISPR-associated protein Cas5 [Paludibacter sp. 47-17]|jgi:CRISPR-associated protein Cas5t|nr:MAG: type I-B CRISPR-associated protein Cas5 [Paludibacter sp. 47-17]
MKVFKIDITAWTSSFKYPNIISGFQPTLEVPPISTVLGLINAAAGKYIKYDKLKIGYYFEFEAKQTDLETIYQIEAHDRGYPKNTTKSNVIHREFMFNNHLILYLQNNELVDYFRLPVYPLLLGRSNDLATVNSIEEVDLKEIHNAEKIKGQIIPLIGNFLPGVIQPLPKYFSATIPRYNLGTEAYSVVSCNSADGQTNLTAYIDYPKDGKEVHIYFHELDFSSYYD